MNDRTAMVVTVVGSHVVMGAVLLTATTVLIGTVNAKLDRLEETVITRFDELEESLNTPIDDLNDDNDDPNDPNDPNDDRF